MKISFRFYYYFLLIVLVAIVALASAGLCDPKKDGKKGKKPEKASHSKTPVNAPATVTVTTENIPAGEFGSEAKAVIEKKRSSASTVNWDDLQETLKKK